MDSKGTGLGRMTLLFIVTLAFLFSCSDATFQAGSSSKSDSQSTGVKASNRTDPDQVQPIDDAEEIRPSQPVPIVGMNLTYSCILEGESATTATVACRARDPGNTLVKVNDVVWSYVTREPLKQDQTVTSTLTPNDPEFDVKFIVTVAANADLAALLAVFQPIAEFAGIKTNVEIIGLESLELPEEPQVPDSTTSTDQTTQTNKPQFCTPETPATTPCVRTRIRYRQDSVFEPDNCEAETQLADCLGANCSDYSGIFAFAACRRERTRYAEEVGSPCKSETQESQCSNGNCSGYSGSYVYTSCKACGGTAVGNYCWYRGNAGADCTTTCNNRGGTTDGTIRYIGWPNGSLKNCNAVLAALGMGAQEASDYQYSTSFGCVLFNNTTRYRYTGTATTQGGGSILTMMSARACSCAN